MSIKRFLYSALFAALLYSMSVGGSGCAQIGQPTGGPKDSIAPVLIASNPKMQATRFTGKKITLVFDEYVVLSDAQKNVLVSPFPKVSPIIESKLKTVTITLKDTLKPNTTYAINFNDAIRDNNEANVVKDFKYVFSTGDQIDSLKLKGNVILAESGKTDSTIIAMLYRDSPDSAVKKRKPDYIARLNGKGNFSFTNLSEGTYSLYALKDGDGSKTYNSPIEGFAFVDSNIIINDTSKTVTLYAYAEEKDKRAAPSASSAPKPANDKKLKYSTNVSTAPQDLLTDLKLEFSKPVKVLDLQKIVLTDTNYKRIDLVQPTLDSTSTRLIFKVKWPEDTDYRLIIDKDAVTDSSDVALVKSDTVRFKTKRVSDYGSLLLRFKDMNLELHPVLQIIKGTDVFMSVPITGTQWSDKLFIPGEYELRILFDANNNGVWDPGNYDQKIQPERATTIDQKLTIKANWDNERDIILGEKK